MSFPLGSSSHQFQQGSMSFPLGSSSHINPNMQLGNVYNLTNSNPSLNHLSGSRDQIPPTSQEYLARYQDIDVGLWRPNPQNLDTFGMLSSHGDGSGSSSMPMGRFPLIDESTSDCFEIPNPRGTYGMSNSTQPITRLSSSGDGLVSSSASKNKSALALLQRNRTQLMSVLSRRPDLVSKYFAANPRTHNNFAGISAPSGMAGTSADIDNSVRNGSSLAEVNTMSSNLGQLICCDFSSEGDMLACIGQDKTMLLWSTILNTFDSRPEIQHRGPITDVRFVPRSSWIAASSSDKTVELWDVYKPSDSLYKLFPYRPVISMDFNPNNKDQLCCADEDEIRLWSVRGSTYEIFFQGGTRQVRFQPGDGNVLATLLMANEIRLFDVETKLPLFSLKGHEKEIHTICWDKSGKYIASVSEDQARVWSIDSTPIYEIKSTGKMFQSCTFHPHYSQAFVIGSYKSLEVWNPSVSNNTESVSAHSGIVSALCTSSKAGLIASTSNDECLKLWRSNQS